MEYTTKTTMTNKTNKTNKNNKNMTDPTPYEQLTVLVSLHLEQLSQDDPDYQVSLEIASQLAQIIPGSQIDTVLNEDDEHFRQRLFRLRPELKPKKETNPSLDDDLLAAKQKRHLPQTLFLHNGRYHGYLIQNQPHGEGTMNFLNGNRYHGKWSYGTPHGYGTMNFQNGDRFQGLWFQGLPHGDGITHYQDGSRHIGQYYGGKPHGAGTLYFNDLTVFSGSFNYNQPVAGKMNWPNGDYLCFSQRNIAHLHHLFQGSLYLHQGEQYHGQLQFKSPTVVSREGTGTHYFPNGHRISGFWKNNLIQLSRPTQNTRNTRNTQNTRKDTPTYHLQAPQLPPPPYYLEKTHWITSQPIETILDTLDELLQPSYQANTPRPIYLAPTLLSTLRLSSRFLEKNTHYNCSTSHTSQTHTHTQDENHLAIPSLLKKDSPPQFKVYIYKMPHASPEGTNQVSHLIEFQIRRGCSITFNHLYTHYKTQFNELTA